MMRWKCECGAIVSENEMLTAPNPFTDTDEVTGCPHCKECNPQWRQLCLAAPRQRRGADRSATLFSSAKHQQMILDLLGEKLTYGCHCDIEAMDEGFLPDDCVFDNGKICDCVYASKLEREGKGRDDCEYWKPIRFALRDKV